MEVCGGGRLKGFGGTWGAEGTTEGTTEGIITHTPIAHTSTGIEQQAVLSVLSQLMDGADGGAGGLGTGGGGGGAGAGGQLQLPHVAGGPAGAMQVRITAIHGGLV